MKTQPSLKAALLFSGGIMVGRMVPLPIPFLFAFLLVLLIILFTLLLRNKQPLILDIAIGLVLALSGFLRYRQAVSFLPSCHITRLLYGPNLAHQKSVHPRWVQVRGYLVKDPVQKTGRVELLVEAEAMRMSDSPEIPQDESSRDSSGYSPVCGKVLVPFYDADSCCLCYGDEVILRGKLERPGPRSNPGGFDYRAYLERRDVYVVLKPFNALEMVKRTGVVRGSAFMRKAVYPIRRHVLKTVDLTTDSETKPVLRALLVGDQGGIPEDVREGFSRSGAIHILSVSGSHVGFILLILSALFGLLRIPQPYRTYVVVFGLFFYCLTAEANPPVVRATLMAAVYLFGTLTEKKSDPFNVIGFAALACLAAAPRDLFDPGFQLSYASVLSIVFFYERLKSLCWIRRAYETLYPHALGRFMVQAVLVSAAAQIGTLPLIAVTFNRIPVLSAAANLVAIPLSGWIVALGFTTCLAAPLHFGTASVYGLLNQKLLWIFLRSMNWIGHLPFSTLSVSSPNAFHLCLYGAVLLFLIRYQSGRCRKVAVFLALVSANGLVWKPVLTGEFRQLTWIQFDVGQGDAGLFRLPGGRCILVDGGDRTPNWDAGVKVLVPALRQLGVRKLDAVVLTHPHDDHCGGLTAVMNQFGVGKVIINGDSSASPVYSEWNRVLRSKKIPVQILLAKDSLCFRGIRIGFLSPQSKHPFESENDRSLVLRISYGSQRWLFMGDAGRATEAALLSADSPL
ncbi:MAG TPA: DNA internalization-related competence protein ComEC/Rec2, partial [bacterium]